MNYYLKPWRLLESKYVFCTKWFKIRLDKVELPNGQIYNEYYVRERLDWAAIFALNDENKLILLKTYKHGSRCVIFELPSGSIEENETPEEGINRELAEETGFSIQKENLAKIGTVLVDPTYTQAKLHIFFGKGAKANLKPNNNPLELSEICLVSLDDLHSIIWKNLSSFPESQIACILLALDYNNRIRGEI